MAINDEYNYDLGLWWSWLEDRIEFNTAEAEELGLLGDVDDVAAEFLAKNNSNSKKAFEERVRYRDEAYRYFVPPIDVWYDKGLYGKVDPDYNTVITMDDWTLGTLTTPVLKKLPSDDLQLFAMNFVVDAFTDLQKYMYEAANRNQIVTKGSVFMPFSAMKGWVSFTERYGKYFDNLYQAFSSTFLNQKQQYKKVNNFKTFIKMFSHFLKRMLPSFPISASGYVLSRQYPLASTGLVIELADANYGDDEVKYNDYISDVNFEFFAGAARRFGFMVDKNAPWRLIADIGSITMQKYMLKYPEKPIDPGEPGHLTPLCTVEDNLFAQYRGQRVVITSSNMALGGESSMGIITNVYCNNPYITPGSPNDAAFEIHTYCPGSDMDLLAVAPRDLSAIRQPKAEFPDEADPAWYGGTRAIGLRNAQPNTIVIVALKEPVTNTITWLNTIFAGESDQWGPGGAIGIKMDQGESVGIDEYKWQIVDTPANSVAMFVDYDFPTQIIPGQDPVSQTGLPTNSISVSTSNSVSNGGLRFKPDVPGFYRLTAEAINLDNPLSPRRVGEIVQVTIRLCVFDEDDITTNRFLTPLVGTSRTITVREFFSVLETEIAQLWSDWTSRHQEEWQRVWDDAATGNPQTAYSKYTSAIKREHLSPLLISFLNHLKAQEIMVPLNNWIPLHLVEDDGYYGAPNIVFKEGIYPVDNFPADGPFSGRCGHRNAQCGAHWKFARLVPGDGFRQNMTFAIALLTKMLRGGANVEIDHIQGPNLDRENIMRVQSAGVRSITTSRHNTAHSTAQGPGIVPFRGAGGDKDYFEAWQDEYNYNSYNQSTIGRAGFEFIQHWLDLHGESRMLYAHTSENPSGQPTRVHNDPADIFSDLVIRRWSAAQIITVMGGGTGRFWQSRERSQRATDPRRSQGHPKVPLMDLVYREFQHHAWNMDCEGEHWFDWGRFDRWYDPIADDPNVNPENPCNIGKYLIPIAPDAASDSRSIAHLRSESRGWEAPRFDDDLIFSLKEEPNTVLAQKRAEYTRAVSQYPQLQTIHYQKSQAKALYLQQLATWEGIHRNDNQLYGGPLTFNNIFKRQFGDTIDIDIPELKNYIMDFYNSYVMAQPYYSVTKIKPTGQGTTTCLVKREEIAKDTMESSYPDSYWVEFYFALRAAESRKKISPGKIRNFRNKVMNILSQVPSSSTVDERAKAMSRIVKLINEETKGAIKEKIT